MTRQRFAGQRPARRGFAALIEIVIVAVLILGGVALYLSLNRDAVSMSKTLDAVDNGNAPSHVMLDDSAPQSMPGRVVQRAKGVQCEENLRSLRTMISGEQAASEDGAYPRTLAAVPGAYRVLNCPTGGEAYEYDATTGQVHCVHPGHEGL